MRPRVTSTFSSRTRASPKDLHSPRSPERTSKGLANCSVYSATKAALRSFARTWTTDLKGQKIRVNVVSPGATDTPGLRGLNQMSGEVMSELYRDRIP